MQRALAIAAMSLVIGALGLGALALGQDHPPQAPTPPATPRPDPTAPPTAPTDFTPEEQTRRAQVVSRFGDVTITLGQVEDGINGMAPFMRARYADPEKRREYVDSLIRFELLAREAVRRRYDRDPDVVRAVNQNAVQQFIKAEFDDRITIESVPMEDVQAYYNTHPEEFNRGEMRRASHILVATREEAQGLVAQARAADPTVFRALAREHSLDTETKLRGGDLGYFGATRREGSQDPQVDPLLTGAAFALREVGDVSEPVQLNTQWTILKLTGLRAAESRAVADAAPSIRMRLWRERRTQALDRAVAELRTRLRAEVHPELVEAIHLDPLPEGQEGAAHPPGTPPSHGARPGAPPGPPGTGPTPPGARSGKSLPAPAASPH